MTVDEYADALVHPGLQLIEEGEYYNRYGQQGYRATYRDSNGFLWFSISGTEMPLAVDEVAVAITAPDRQIQREYPYWNRNGQPGFEATVRSGEHSFMLNAAPDLPRTRG